MVESFLRAKDEEGKCFCFVFYLRPVWKRHRKRHNLECMCLCVCVYVCKGLTQEDDYLRVLRHPAGGVSLEESEEKEGYGDRCVRGFVKQYRDYLMRGLWGFYLKASNVSGANSELKKKL